MFEISWEQTRESCTLTRLLVYGAPVAIQAREVTFLSVGCSLRLERLLSSAKKIQREFNIKENQKAFRGGYRRNGTNPRKPGNNRLFDLPTRFFFALSPHNHFRQQLFSLSAIEVTRHAQPSSGSTDQRHYQQRNSSAHGRRPVEPVPDTASTSIAAAANLCAIRTLT